jgi:Tol biopolymer transport system component
LLFGVASTTGMFSVTSAEDLSAELKEVPHRIVYETYRDGNWELFSIDADGSRPVNLTRTPDVDELYPHASPDGTKICFVADEGTDALKVRSVYYANTDGSGRTLVARKARQPCWGGDGTAIAYLGGELDQFSYSLIANKGLFIHELATGKHRAHPNKDICHLFNVCWSPDGRWFVATVHAGMGYKHALIAIEADGMKVLDLGISGCRPEFSPDGKRIAWTPNDWVLRVGDLDLTGPKPKVVNQRDVVSSSKPTKVYHIDWSPDARHVVFSRGPSKKRLGRAPENVGTPADGWNICVADATKANRWVAITSDGNSNKEPDWMFVEKKTQ